MNVIPQQPSVVSHFLSTHRKLLIDGKWVDSVSGKTFEVFDPATGEVIANVAEACGNDVDIAVKAARKAFDEGPWPTMAPSHRARLIWKLADAIETHADELALIETLDSGKPFKVARRRDIVSSVERLRYYAGWATKLTGETFAAASQSSARFHTYTIREPVGVAGLITPWNAPLQMAATKLAPALAAGCTVILKPAEQTPLSALRLGELIQDIGFPDGVVNILTGFGDVGAALVEHHGVDKVSFTGSTEVGRLIIKAAAGNLKRVTLELGGKSPVIVFPDADTDVAVDGIAQGIFANTGQVCAAGSRLFAHERIFDRLVDGIAAKAKKLRIGPGVEPDTDMGPVVSLEQLERVTGYIRSGVEGGAEFLIGGGRLERPGYFVQPTILTSTTREMSVRREEIFGPVLCAMSFSEENIDRIAEEANDTEYGLAGYIYTRDLSTAHKMARKIRAGSIRINGGSSDINVPFGGFKQSGWGREHGYEGVDSFTEIKAVSVAL